MKKNKKTIYETPIIIPLGELARGSGAKPIRPCTSGGGAKDSCSGGSGVPPQDSNNCNNGSVASKRCTSGTGV